MNTEREIGRRLNTVLKTSFDLKRYEPMNDLSIKDWAAEWCYRFQLMAVLKARSAPESDTIKRSLTEAMTALLFFPVLSQREHPEFESTTGSAIKPLRVADLNGVYEELFGERNDESFDDVLVALRKDYTKRNEEEKKLCNQSIDSLLMDRLGQPHFQPILVVDLDASDEQIIEHFRKWLREEREQHVREVKRKPEIYRKSVSEKDVSKWIQFRVPAYVDLMLFEEWLSPARLTDPQKAALLFPDEYEVDRVSRLRKVVQKEAQRVTEAAFIDAFTRQTRA